LRLRNAREQQLGDRLADNRRNHFAYKVCEHPNIRMKGPAG